MAQDPVVNMLPGAIADYGFRVVVSSFFADIHKNNELNNFVLPVVVTEEFLAELFDSIFKNPKMEVEVNLPEQTITNKPPEKVSILKSMPTRSTV